MRPLPLVQYPCLPCLRNWHFHSDCLGLRPRAIGLRHNERRRLLRNCPDSARASVELREFSSKDRAELNGALAAPGVALEVSHVSMAFGDKQVRSYSCSASEIQQLCKAIQELLCKFWLWL